MWAFNAYFQKTYPSHTIFVDQVTIARSHQRKGVASMLDDFLVNHTPHNNTWVTDIVHKPVKNEASSQFFINRGFVEAGEQEQDDWILGIYERRK